MISRNKNNLKLIKIKIKPKTTSNLIIQKKKTKLKSVIRNKLKKMEKKKI